MNCEAGRYSGMRLNSAENQDLLRWVPKPDWRSPTLQRLESWQLAESDCIWSDHGIYDQVPIDAGCVDRPLVGNLVVKLEATVDLVSGHIDTIHPPGHQISASLPAHPLPCKEVVYGRHSIRAKHSRKNKAGCQ